jgi:hypothetical protein
VCLQVTPQLFKRAPDAAAMAAMEVAAIQAIIQPIGLAPTKAKNLSNMSKVGPVPAAAALLRYRCNTSVLLPRQLAERTLTIKQS